MYRIQYIIQKSNNAKIKHILYPYCILADVTNIGKGYRLNQDLNLHYPDAAESIRPPD